MPLSYTIAVIAGDGIGKEVIPAAMRVLDGAAEASGSFQLNFESLPWGSDYYLQHGRMMPADGLNNLEEFDAIFLGAVGLPPTVPDHVTLWGLLLPIRKSFEQYVNIRPVRLLPGLIGRLRDKGPEDIDFVCVRENTEGEYAGIGGRFKQGTPEEVAVQTSVFTRLGCERAMRYAFDLARRRRGKLTSVTKSNAMQYGMVMWDEVFRDVARDYPDVETEQWLVDAMAARFLTHPQTLDVVVASNLFGDILTDLGGALMGSLGLPPSANINPQRNYPSMFEPVHGSAPDIAGKGIANPIAAIWAGVMMLEFLGEEEAGARVMEAIGATVAAGDVLTRDLGGNATTGELATEIARRVATSQD